MMLVDEVDSHFSLLGFSLTENSKWEFVELTPNYVNGKWVYLKVGPSPFSALKLIQ